MLIRPYQLLLLYLLLTYAYAQAPGHIYKYKQYGPGHWGVYTPAGRLIRQLLATCITVINKELLKFGAEGTYTYSETGFEGNQRYEVHLTYDPLPNHSTFDRNDFIVPSYELLSGSSRTLEFVTQGVADIVIKANECYAGKVFYDVYEYDKELKKRSEVDVSRDMSDELRFIKNVTDHGNMYSGFQDGLGHPYNQKDYAMPTIPWRPSNGPICKRHDLGDMITCTSHDTLLAGSKLYEGTYPTSAKGQRRLVIFGDGNLCLHDGKKGRPEVTGSQGYYWCANPGIPVRKRPLYLKVEMDGTLKMYDAKGGLWWYGGSGKTWGQYRLTLQNDGNLVMYDANGKATFSSGTNIFPETGPKPCNKR